MIALQKEADRILICPLCNRVASAAPWIERPICVHDWSCGGPEIWDGNNQDEQAGRFIEQAPNEKWRVPGSDTWAEMIPYD